MAYTVIIENRAQKDFLKLEMPHTGAVKKHINELEKNPRSPGVKKLAGTTDGYRVRAGDYRILYTIDERRKIVTIYRIRHRREVYR
jgi:mRNA interferase RelE/StbE